MDSLNPANRFGGSPSKSSTAEMQWSVLFWEKTMEKRLGFVGIIIENRDSNAGAVNELLAQFGHLIVARTGVPYEKRSCSAITLIIDASTDELGVLTGKLGNLTGISVKSMLSKQG
jgi:putative iron-only hydrogenase system regulator